MNQKKIMSFLNSMDKSCEGYSTKAFANRQKLQDVNNEFRKIDQNVKDTLNVVHRNSSTRPHTTIARTRSASARRRPKTAQENAPKMVIRPAPFPIKNYILPAQELVGPKRYYRSNASQKIKKQKEEVLEEFEKYPYSFENSPRELPPELVVTPTQTFNRSRDEYDDWSLGGSSCRSDFGNF